MALMSKVHSGMRCNLSFEAWLPVWSLKMLPPTAGRRRVPVVLVVVSS